MPRVPVYDLPQTSQAALPGVRIQPGGDSGFEAIQSGIGLIQRGVDRASSEMERAKKEADDLRIDEADLLFGQETNDALNGKDGLLNRQGTAALDLKPTLERLTKAREKIARGLASDEQRAKFDLRARVRTEQARDAANKHVADQQLGLYRQTADGHMKLALDAARLNYSNPAAIESAIAKVLAGPNGEPGPLERYMAAQGLPEEKRAAIRADFISDAHAEAIRTYLAKQDTVGALKHFAQVQKKLGDKAPEIEKSIAGRIENLKELEERARKREEDERLGRVGQQIYASGGWLDRSTKDFLALSDEGKLKAIKEAHSLKRSNRAQRGEENKLQREADRDALAEFNSLSPEEQAQANVDAFVMGRGMSKAAQFGIVSIQKKAKKDLEKGGLAKRADFEKQVESIAKGIKNKEHANRFRASLWQWWAEFPDESGTLGPTPKDIREKLVDARKEVEVDGFIFDRKKPKYLVGPDDKVVSEDGQKVDEIPPADRAQIEAALKASGKPVIEPAVRRLFQLAKETQ